MASLRSMGGPSSSPRSAVRRSASTTPALLPHAAYTSSTDTPAAEAIAAIVVPENPRSRNSLRAWSNTSARVSCAWRRRFVASYRRAGGMDIKYRLLYSLQVDSDEWEDTMTAQMPA